MKQEHKPMTWLVKYFDYNAQKITDYDALKYREDEIKQMKKKCKNKEEFATKLRREFMWSYWSKCEWELIIELTEDNHIFLKPWISCRDATIDVTDDNTFDWKGFAAEHIRKQIYKNEAKVSVWDQIEYQWDSFIDYCWNYHHKWQRKNTKLTQTEFIEKYCSGCGSQRCEGINTEWFDGCLYKDELRV